MVKPRLLDKGLVWNSFKISFSQEKQTKTHMEREREGGKSDGKAHSSLTILSVIHSITHTIISPLCTAYTGPSVYCGHVPNQVSYSLSRAHMVMVHCSSVHISPGSCSLCTPHDDVSESIHRIRYIGHMIVDVSQTTHVSHTSNATVHFGYSV